MLTREQARAFYDRFGARQDGQGFYEDPATRELVAHAGFERAGAVFELGCGTGRFAAELLAHYLPSAARYAGCDLSPTMIELARGRLRPFGDRAEVRLTDGSPPLDLSDASVDRFVSNYVLDLLPADDVRQLLREAHRVLTPDGRLCLVSLTHGVTVLSRLVSRLWTRVHAWRPDLVGGCRPLALRDFAAADAWTLEHHRVVVAWGVPSEVLVARKATPGARP